MIDWRGQGLSERALRNPRKGYVRSFDHYGVDLATFIQEVVLPDCPPPVFALAHSMGASILRALPLRGIAGLIAWSCSRLDRAAGKRAPLPADTPYGQGHASIRPGRRLCARW